MYSILTFPRGRTVSVRLGSRLRGRRALGGLPGGRGGLERGPTGERDMGEADEFGRLMLDGEEEEDALEEDGDNDDGGELELEENIYCEIVVSLHSWHAG